MPPRLQRRDRRAGHLSRLSPFVTSEPLSRAVPPPARRRSAGADRAGSGSPPPKRLGRGSGPDSLGRGGGEGSTRSINNGSRRPLHRPAWRRPGRPRGPAPHDETDIVPAQPPTRSGILYNNRPAGAGGLGLEPAHGHGRPAPPQALDVAADGGLLAHEPGDEVRGRRLQRHALPLAPARRQPPVHVGKEGLQQRLHRRLVQKGLQAPPARLPRASRQPPCTGQAPSRTSRRESGASAEWSSCAKRCGRAVRVNDLPERCGGA